MHPGLSFLPPSAAHPVKRIQLYIFVCALLSLSLSFSARLSFRLPFSGIRARFCLFIISRYIGAHPPIVLELSWRVAFRAAGSEKRSGAAFAASLKGFGRKLAPALLPYTHIIYIYSLCGSVRVVAFFSFSAQRVLCAVCVCMSFSNAEISESEWLFYI